MLILLFRHHIDITIRIRVKIVLFARIQRRGIDVFFEKLSTFWFFVVILWIWLCLFRLRFRFLIWVFRYIDNFWFVVLFTSLIHLLVCSTFLFYILIERSIIILFITSILNFNIIGMLSNIQRILKVILLRLDLRHIPTSFFTWLGYWLYSGLSW